MNTSLIKVADVYDVILLNISHYQWTGDCNSLLASICLFVENAPIWHNPTINDPSITWNVNTPICLALLDVSHHYKEGAQKYGERNWEKGIPLHSYIDSGVRHLIKFVLKILYLVRIIKLWTVVNKCLNLWGSILSFW